MSDHGARAVLLLEQVIATVERDPGPVYSDPDALFGIAHPGTWAGQVERLLGELPTRHRQALRRAAKAVAAEYRTPKAQGSQGAYSLPPVVCYGPTWWVHKPEEDRYLPVQRGNAIAELQRSGVEVGGEKRLSPDDAYLAWGVTALAVRWVYELGEPLWNTSTRTLDLPGATVREGRVSESARVARWLSLLGGQREDRLLDWLATAGRLDLPTAALQLGGAADSVGKQLLVAGLTAWLGGMVSYDEGTGPYSAELVQNPVVWLDEGTKDPRPDAFRRITGNKEHRVQAKFRMSETLIGCPRLVITSNEADPLGFGALDLSAKSEEAIGLRIVQIQAEAPAATYLARWDTHGEGWATFNGELTAHLRWLAANRKVQLGRRLCVHGDGSEWVSTAHLRSGVGSDLVVAFRTYLAEPALREKCEGDPFLFESDLVGISVSELLAVWRTLLGPQERIPSQQKLGKALERLAGGPPVRPGPEDHRGPRRYWVARAKLEE